MEEHEITTVSAKRQAYLKQEYCDKDAKIYLRLMTLADTADIVSWRNSAGIRRWFIYREDFTTESHLHWIHSRIETGEAVQMMICSQDDNRTMGSVYIRDIDRQNKKAECGIFLNENSRKIGGVGTAATKLMLRYCAREEKLHRVYARILADNSKSIGCFRKSGFLQEGVFVQDVLINGEFKDIVRLGIILEN